MSGPSPNCDGGRSSSAGRWRPAGRLPAALLAAALVALLTATAAPAAPAAPTSLGTPASPTSLASPADDRADALDFLVSRQSDGGGFAEPGRQPDPSLTAWVVLALAAGGRDPASVQHEGSSPIDYLTGKPYPTATDLELRILALAALGRVTTARSLADRLETLRRDSGAIGPTVNSTIWGVIALRTLGRAAGSKAISYLLGRQSKDGGWSWFAGGASDSNDTAAAVQALRSAGVGARSKAIRRALVYLRELQNADGGFELSSGRGSDAQSTAWVIQAFLAAGRAVPRGAFAYLARLQRGDGSYRYSSRFATTPVWVTATVLPALARRPFPL